MPFLDFDIRGQGALRHWVSFPEQQNWNLRVTKIAKAEIHLGNAVSTGPGLPLSGYQPTKPLSSRGARREGGQEVTGEASDP